MFADPQTITINAVAQTLPRTSNSSNTALYKKDDGTVIISTSQIATNKKRWRRTLQLDHSKISADPYLPATNVLVGMKASLLVDVPPAGYSLVEQKQVVDALIAYFTASSGAKVTQLLGGEI